MAVETMTETAALYARQEDRLNPVLEMRGISQIFPGVKALDNVDIQLYSGQVTALIGENGAGKSTLVKILTVSIAPMRVKFCWTAHRFIFKARRMQSMQASLPFIRKPFCSTSFRLARTSFSGMRRRVASG